MNTESRTPIDFYFDFSSPYSYIANEWIDALAARHGRVVRRRAILLGVTFQAAELKSPVSYPIKRDYALRDFARSARFEGLPYLMPSTFPIPTQNAARVFWWLQETQGAEAAAAWTRSAFRAFFTRDIVLSDPPRSRPCWPNRAWTPGPPRRPGTTRSGRTGCARPTSRPSPPASSVRLSS
jgi:2-hydroxychromene-2-carboxylate isomerase